MTTDGTALAALLARVRAAAGPDRELDMDLEERVGDRHVNRWEQTWHVGDQGGSGSVPEYTASIDAAVGLVERVLPGWQRVITNGGKPRTAACSLRAPNNGAGRIANGAPTEPLAIIAALLAALSEQQPGRQP